MYTTGGAIPRDVNYDAGGGGGGGYYGGGGGSGGQAGKIAQSGAGGSGYANPAYASHVTYHTTPRDATTGMADGAPMAEDPSYVQGVARGGAGSTSSSTVGGDGLVVITYYTYT